jgi:hypothetical protein
VRIGNIRGPRWWSNSVPLEDSHGKVADLRNRLWFLFGFYLASAATAGVALLGLQAIVVPHGGRTKDKWILLGALAAYAVVAFTARHVRNRRRQRAGLPVF